MRHRNIYTAHIASSDQASKLRRQGVYRLRSTVPSCACLLLIRLYAFTASIMPKQSSIKS